MPVHSKGDQPWDFFGRNDAKAETPVHWPPRAKSWLIGEDSDAGRDWGQKNKGTTEDEMTWWHHWLNGRKSEWTLGVDNGQRGLACCNSWGRKESDTTEQLNWTESYANENHSKVLWQLEWTHGERKHQLHQGYRAIGGHVNYVTCVLHVYMYCACILHVCMYITYNIKLF